MQYANCVSRIKSTARQRVRNLIYSNRYEYHPITWTNIHRCADRGNMIESNCLIIGTAYRLQLDDASAGFPFIEQFAYAYCCICTVYSVCAQYSLVCHSGDAIGPHSHCGAAQRRDVTETTCRRAAQRRPIMKWKALLSELAHAYWYIRRTEHGKLAYNHIISARKHNSADIRE